MVVDDDEISAQLLCEILLDKFEVATFFSGSESLAGLESFKPDLILLDVDMPVLNGFETCKQIRAKEMTVPIIFVTSYQNIEVQLEAFDSGGNDILIKPANPDILIHKATLAIHQNAEAERLSHEAKSMHDMALSLLSTAGENGILLKFVSKAVAAKSYEDLAVQLVDAVNSFDVTCSVMLRHDEHQVTLSSHGETTSLEQAILAQMSGLGRLIEYKRQFIVNYEHVSLMISNAPVDSPERLGRLRDNAAILAENTEALCDNVAMRMESIARSEQMQLALFAAGSAVEKVRNNHKRLLHDTRILLEEMVDKVESTFSKLNTSRSDEIEISSNMHDSVNRILSLISTENNFDEEITKVHEALSFDNKNNENIFY
jgi:DNA-binding response OmpR family regulator